jgi:hypothetical protein
MSMGIYSKGENRFLPDMEGVDPMIMGFPVPGTWGLHTPKSWVFLYPKHGSSYIWAVCLHVPECGVPTYPKRGPRHS